ncbi:MAG: ATP-binding protein [Gemmatimonas sp.]
MIDGPEAQVLMKRLAQHRALGAAPANEHAWLIAHGTFRRLAAGETLLKRGVSAPMLNIVLSGHLAIRVDRGAGLHKIIEWGAGDVSGLLPFSRGTNPPGDVIAEEATEQLEVLREHFPEMIRECPAITAVMVHAMLDRARQFTSNDLRDEKLVSLGKLAAGLAHELNNPASAVVRGAKLLTESIDASETAARQLGEARLSAEQLAAIDEIRVMCLKAAPTMMRSAVGRSDREDEFLEWLADHGADERCAGPLAETGVTIEAVDTLASIVDGDVLNATLKWMAAGCNVRTLAADIEMAATRIHDLVGAVKGFTYMDHAPTPEPVDIRQGIADTLTMLASKVRAKSVHVELSLPDDLPRAHVVGAELNQVWMNLIDNALDAVAVNGRVDVAAALERGRVVVRIIDNGPGIPTEVVGRIFDPFFTTKGVGKGTGLGLDIVRRLLQRHEGEIAVDSVPGRTEFQVRLRVVAS